VNARSHPWILAIEDSDSDLYLLQRVLDESPYPEEIVRARDGEQAISLIRELAGGGSDPLPDLIFIDLNMPRVDGLEVLEQIAKEVAFRAVPLIVVTSSQQDTDRQLAMARGADAYFVKPLEFSSYKGLLKIMDEARSSRSRKAAGRSCS